MNKFFKVSLVLGAQLAGSGAHAGPYSDDLSKCLVDTTTRDDRTALVRWMFTAASAHPAVASISSATPKEIDEANQVVGKLFMRLLTESCAEAASKAVKYEGPNAIETGFNTLGQVAGSELFSSPEVTAAMTGLQKYLDPKKLETIGK
ncbi:MAG TPA: hypothetical protein VF277_10645 [Steroidobacteraceae bacterium]